MSAFACRYDRLDVDLDLMEAHFSVIRVGESVWSTWEPENGQFNLDWLEPVLNGAARRGISVILKWAGWTGTPVPARGMVRSVVEVSQAGFLRRVARDGDVRGAARWIAG
jgi:beta-galactosidase GanA